MEQPIETYKHKGYTINVYLDEYGGNDPRDWDNLGTMVCWHSRYILGDEQPGGDSEDYLKDLACSLDDTLADRIDYWENGLGWVYLANNFDDPVAECDERIRSKVWMAIDKYIPVLLPLRLYDHGGISMSTSHGYPYNCPWDSGYVGYIYVTREQIRKEYGKERVSRKVKATVRRVLENEVKVYDWYLQGAVYGYVVRDPEGEEIEYGSCWGFFGWDHKESGLLESAKDEIDSDLERIEQEKRDEVKRHGEYLKRAIRAGVPVEYRQACPVG